MYGIPGGAGRHGGGCLRQVLMSDKAKDADKIRAAAVALGEHRALSEFADLEERISSLERRRR